VSLEDLLETLPHEEVVLRDGNTDRHEGER
jgi:hypothetical protein